MTNKNHSARSMSG